ncbi:MAG: hypothetical protein NTX45_16790 [Proteobacteria bacterium]|nr:hypothetical protein [Pseudomonadota bacterium]
MYKETDLTGLGNFPAMQRKATNLRFKAIKLTFFPFALSLSKPVLSQPNGGGRKNPNH